MIVVTWEVAGIGDGRATATGIDAVPAAVEQIIADAVRRYAGGVVASVLPRMLSPLIGAMLADVRRGLVADGRWEYRADALSVVVVEDVSPGQSLSA